MRVDSPQSWRGGRGSKAPPWSVSVASANGQQPNLINRNPGHRSAFAMAKNQNPSVFRGDDFARIDVKATV